MNAGFDKHDLPMDVIWLDIEHTDGKKYVFTADCLRSLKIKNKYGYYFNSVQVLHLAPDAFPYTEADD